MAPSRGTGSPSNWHVPAHQAPASVCMARMVALTCTTGPTALQRPFRMPRRPRVPRVPRPLSVPGPARLLETRLYSTTHGKYLRRGSQASRRPIIPHDVNTFYAPYDSPCPRAVRIIPFRNHFDISELVAHRARRKIGHAVRVESPIPSQFHIAHITTGQSDSLTADVFAPSLYFSSRRAAIEDYPLLFTVSVSAKNNQPNKRRLPRHTDWCCMLRLPL